MIRIEKFIASAIAWILFIIGFFVFLNWEFTGKENNTLLKIGLTLNYFAAVSIFLCGLSLLNLIYAKKIQFFKIIILPIFILLILRFISLITQYDLGLNSIFSEKFLKYKISNSKLLLGGTISLTASTLALLIWPVKKRTPIKSFLIIALLSLSFTNALIGSILYFLSLNPQDFILDIPIHPVFAVLIMLFNIGLFIWNSYEDKVAKSKKIKWQALIFANGILIFHYFLISGLIHEQRLYVKNSLEEKGGSIQETLKNKFFLIGDLLNEFAVRVSKEKNLNDRFLLLDAENFNKEEIYLKHIVCFDKNLSIQSMIPTNPPNGISEIETVLEKNKSSLFYKTTSANFLSADLGKIFLVRSIYWDNEFQGGILFEVSLRDLISASQIAQTTEGLYTRLYLNGNLIFSLNAQENLSLRLPSYTSHFSILNMQYALQLYPTPKLLFIQITQNLVFFIVLGGITSSLLVAILIYVLQVLREKIQIFKKTNKQLIIYESIINAFNESTTVHEACQKMLILLNSYFDWCFLAFLKKNVETQKFEIISVNNSPLSSNSLFERELQNLSSFKNTIISETIITKEPVQIEDYANSPYALKNAVIHDGFKGALSVPLFTNGALFGLFLLFKKKPYQADPEEKFLEILTNLGNELRYFIERKEANLKDSQLFAIQENSNDALFKINPSFDICTWSAAAETILGWTENEILGQPLSMLFDEYQEVEQIKGSLIKIKLPKKHTFKRKKKNGELFWTESTFIPLFDTSGEMVLCWVFLKDISNEKKQNQTILRLEQKLEKIIDSTHTWVWETNLAGDFTYTSFNCDLILGYAPIELLNLNLFNLTFDTHHHKKWWKESVALEKGWKNQIWQVQTKDKSLIWLSSNGYPIFNSDNRIIGYCGIEQNISLKLLSEESKNEFLSLLSHEIKTPLTSIMGASEIIPSVSPMDMRQKEFLEIIQKNTDKILKLINRISNFEKFMLNEMSLSCLIEEVKPILEEAIQISRPIGLKHQIEIVANSLIPDMYVLVDREALVQVILNLISNAIKFSKENSQVHISMHLKEGIIVIEVKDFGCGIPSDQQDKIFDKFFQGNHNHFKKNGMGLGLYFCKHLIQHMHGKIRLTSKFNEGSSFYIELPIAQRPLQ